MKKTTILNLLFILMVIFVVGCNKQAINRGDNNEKQTNPEEETILELNTFVGDVFNVDLKGNPTTGYSWIIENIDKKYAKFIEKRFVSKSNLTGSGGMFSLNFRAVKPGVSDIKLVYCRPWQCNKTREKEKIIKVVISEKECSSDSDCVPAICCHASSCTTKENKPNCEKVVCTDDCTPNTMDCGQGSCRCIANSCVALMKGNEQMECESKGGRWEKIGTALVPRCNLPTSDKGKDCQSNRECESVCLAPKGAKQGEISTGKCYGWELKVGCYSSIDDGIVNPMICVD